MPPTFYEDDLTGGGKFYEIWFTLLYVLKKCCYFEVFYWFDCLRYRGWGQSIRRWTTTFSGTPLTKVAGRWSLQGGRKMKKLCPPGATVEVFRFTLAPPPRPSLSGWERDVSYERRPNSYTIDSLPNRPLIYYIIRNMLPLFKILLRINAYPFIGIEISIFSRLLYRLIHNKDKVLFEIPRYCSTLFPS